MTCPNCELKITLTDAIDGQVINCPNCDFPSEVHIDSYTDLTTGDTTPITLLEPLDLPLPVPNA